MLTSGTSSYFLVSITGQIEEAVFPDHDDLYCRLFWVCGQDWAVTAGQEEGVTQVGANMLNTMSILCLVPGEQEESGYCCQDCLELPSEHYTEEHQSPWVATVGPGCVWS